MSADFDYTYVFNRHLRLLKDGFLYLCGLRGQKPLCLYDYIRVPAGDIYDAVRKALRLYDVLYFGFGLYIFGYGRGLSGK